MTGTARTDVSMSPVGNHDGKTCAGGGHNAFGAAGWLGLAAAPTFAIMALWTGLFSGQPDMLCMGMRDASPLNGMALMYALMAAFHATPWLRLVRRWLGRSKKKRLAARPGVDLSSIRKVSRPLFISRSARPVFGAGDQGQNQ
jgi:hypothetical protein